MPIILKSPRQIDFLNEAGRIVADTFEILHQHVQPGITTAELDAIAEDYIRSRDAEPVYKGYGAQRPTRHRAGRKAFPASICASVNDVICHGIPSPRERLKAGDIIGIDIGVRYQGWVGDSCVTFAVGHVSPDVQRLLDIARECLDVGIEQARVGKRFLDIGHAIQAYAESHHFSVVREYTGHGVGRKLHEDPTVLHYAEPKDTNAKRRLVEGMVFTIEPMINAGSATAELQEDGWTVKTADGSLSAQFEHQLAITSNGPRILTQ